MARKRYRTIVKVLCSDCRYKVDTKQVFEKKCANCEYVKYNNVTNLLSFTKLLHDKFPNWVYFNVYEYKKGAPGVQCGFFIKGKKEPVSITI